MSKFVLIIIAGGFISWGIINVSLNSSVSQGNTNAISAYSSEVSRSISESVAGMVISNLADSTSWRVSTPDTQNIFDGKAAYTISDTVISSDSLVKVSVSSEYNGVQSNLTAYVSTLSGSKLPAFLDYAIITDGDFKISGNSKITSYPPGSENANIHSNGSITINGTPEIKGFLTYTGSAGSVSKLNSSVQPVSNPGNIATYYQTPEIIIPEFNPEDYLAKATTVYPGDETISGYITLGTKDNPAIIYVGGDATIKESSITGYGSIIVKGDITVTGSNTFAASDPDGNPLGLFTAGKFTLEGNSSVYATIYAKGEVKIAGSGSVYGQIISKNEIKLTGTGDIYFIPPISAITNTYWENIPGIDPGYGFNKTRTVIKYWFE